MSNRIEDLEPKTKELCDLWKEQLAAHDISVRITQTLRTMDEQNRLYASGRTLPGPKITNAKAGQSPHNWGMAFDFCFEGKSPYPKEGDPRWEQIARIGESLSLTWGGRWKTLSDRDHFERSNWRLAITKGGTG